MNDEPQQCVMGKVNGPQCPNMTQGRGHYVCGHHLTKAREIPEKKAFWENSMIRHEMQEKERRELQEWKETTFVEMRNRAEANKRAIEVAMEEKKEQLQWNHFKP